jgi:hypothetical protein
VLYLSRAARPYFPDPYRENPLASQAPVSAGLRRG